MTSSLQVLRLIWIMLCLWRIRKKSKSKWNRSSRCNKLSCLHPTTRATLRLTACSKTTSSRRPSTRMKAAPKGASYYLPKPWDRTFWSFQKRKPRMAFRLCGKKSTPIKELKLRRVATAVKFNSSSYNCRHSGIQMHRLRSWVTDWGRRKLENGQVLYAMQCNRRSTRTDFANRKSRSLICSTIW